MRTLFLLLALSVLGVGCGDDSGAGAPDGSADGGDGDGDGDGNGDGDGDGDGDAPDGGDGDGDGDGDSGTDGGEPGEDTVSKMIGPEGGTLTSSDGKITLTFPEGALSRQELITIELLPQGESKALVDDATELASYAFGPDGLAFDEPVELTGTFEGLVTPGVDEDDEVEIPFILVSTFSETTLQYLERHDLAVDLGSGDATLSTDLMHFSHASFEVFPPINKLGTPFFYMTVTPIVPREMELTKDYGIGLRFTTRHFLDEDLPFTYRDLSDDLTYSGGTDPIDIGSVPGGEAPPDYLWPAGSYRCDELGAATFEARVLSEVFIPPLVQFECEGATDTAKCFVYTGPVLYSARLYRTVDCIPDEAVNPEPGEPPYSGVVIWERRRVLNPMGVSQPSSGLHAAFYDGGADQAGFDAYVAAQLRKLGIADDRGADGTCRPVDPSAITPNALDFDFTTSHLGTGTDDVIGIDFVTPPSEPLFTAEYTEPFGFYESDFVYNEAFTDDGIEIYLPVGAASPAITLPGWDENITTNRLFTPQSSLAALDDTDIAISWQADEVGGEHIHIWGVGNDAESDAAAFECFASVEDQLVTIPSETITALFPAMTDPLYITIYVVDGSYTSVEYDGRTLIGLNLHTFGREATTEIID